MSSEKYPKRKIIRLEGYDYNAEGIYFVTVCTKERKQLFCKINPPTVGTVVLDGPLVQMTRYGSIVENRLDEMSNFYDDVKLDAYVVMPNHIHLLIRVTEDSNGPSGTTVPTSSKIGRFVGTMKRMTNREIGGNVWQRGSHDVIVRSEEQYCKIAEYIEHNPRLWLEDRYYQ